MVTHTSTLGVGTGAVDGVLLRVRQCPTMGPVEFVTAGDERAGDVIDVFDISGRRVGVVQVAPGSGTRMVRWDWLGAGCRPGVCLARLRSRGGHMTRLVVLH